MIISKEMFWYDEVEGTTRGWRYCNIFAKTKAFKDLSGTKQSPRFFIYYSAERYISTLTIKIHTIRTNNVIKRKRA